MTPNLRRDLAEIVTPTSASSQLTLLEVSSLGGKGKGKNSPTQTIACKVKTVFSSLFLLPCSGASTTPHTPTGTPRAVISRTRVDQHVLYTFQPRGRRSRPSNTSPSASSPSAQKHHNRRGTQPLQRSRTRTTTLSAVSSDRQVHQDVHYHIPSPFQPSRASNASWSASSSTTIAAAEDADKNDSRTQSFQPIITKIGMKHLQTLDQLRVKRR